MNLHKKKMHFFDAEGNSLGPPEDVPEPETVPNGLAALSIYTMRLFDPKTAHASLMAFTTDERGGFGVARYGDETHLLLSVDWRQYGRLEQAYRSFVKRHRLALVHDYLAGNGLTPDATRCLDYVLPNSAEAVSAICQGLLTECCGVHEHEALKIALSQELGSVQKTSL